MHIGIDIGGTSLKAGLVDDDYSIINRASVPIDPREVDFGYRLIEKMVSVSKNLVNSSGMRKEDLAYIGAGFPGSVDPTGGVVLFTPNIPIKNLPVAKGFEESFGLPLYIGNDANCAALGEYYAGAGKDAASLFFFTLGTGVGSGFVSKGKLFTGFNGLASEAGHTLVQIDGRKCGCGRRGCLEAYASAMALRKDTINSMIDNPDSLMWEVAGGLLDNVTGKTAFDAKKLGDKAASEICANYVHYLAQGIVNVINMLGPELVCIGGGISNADDEDLLIPLRQEVFGSDSMFCYSKKKTEIIKAKLGNDAGIIGASLLGK